MFSKDPLQGNKRVGNVLEAGQKGVNTCIGLVLRGGLGDLPGQTEDKCNGWRPSEGGCLEEDWEAVCGVAQERSRVPTEGGLF